MNNRLPQYYSNQSQYITYVDKTESHLLFMFVNLLHLDSATDWWGFHTEITTLESFGGKNYFACYALRKLIAMVHLRAWIE